MAKQAKKQQETILKERPDRLLARIVRSSNVRSKKDIQQWRVALQQAENADNPKRILLYNVYNEILLDAHLSAEIERRVNALLGSRFDLYDENGTAQPEASVLLQKTWFKNLLRYCWEKILWGHSLIEIDSLTADGLIGSVRLINRWHVIPEKGLVTLKQGDEAGINYRLDKKYAPWLFDIGDTDDLGLLNKCVPHVIFKRFAQSAYSEYCEILGIPPRVLKTDAYDKEHLNRSEDMLANMGTNSYAVIGKDEEIIFVQSGSGNSAETFTNLFKLSSNEISKLINGAVLGEDSADGSRAKEQVSHDIMKDIHQSDKTMIESLINEQILPHLVEMGYPFAGLSFEFVREKNLKEELDMALRIAQQFEMDDEGIAYMNQTFSVPVVKQKQQSAFGDMGATAKAKPDFFD
ncbi:MAG TPA: DUF935 family protein [Crocinitomicaceae bacterium]|nr:DUF935 family protein [Crocinitomicaceae bacterium]